MSLKILPSTHTYGYSLDLSKNHKTMIYLNLAALGLTGISFVFFVWLANLFHPDLLASGFSFQLGLSSLPALLIFLVLLVAVFSLHEMIHGLFFWIFTQARPIFGVGPGYLYAAAPDWYIPFSLYWIVGLSPLVLISLLGVVALAVLPSGWAYIVAFLIALNAGGAAGDLWIILRLLWFRSPTGLINDNGHCVTLYLPKKAAT